MNKSNIGFRHFFKPVQPLIHRQNEIRYEELLPEPRLADYIYCYWQLKSEYKLLSPFSYRVIPDGCIDIFFDVSNSSEARVMGFSNVHTEFLLDTCFNYVGIRFFPGAFPFVFNLDAAPLTNRDERFDDVVPGAAKDLASFIGEESELEKIRFLFDKFFLKKIASISNVVDMRFYNAIMTILKTHGTLNLQSELDTGISPRQLRRLFEYYVGISPKMFSKVVRFQYFFQMLTASQGNSFNKVFLEAGYYDQPHFNKDFKAFFGLTPTEALQR
jgi:AraC-like DNA-binding protein